MRFHPTHVPLNSDGNLLGMLKGYVLVEYRSPESAEKAKELADGYEMDKSHTFQAFLLPDVLEALEISGEFKEEKALQYPGEGKGPLFWWIMEEDAQDQFALLHLGQCCHGLTRIIRAINVNNLTSLVDVLNVITIWIYYGICSTFKY